MQRESWMHHQKKKKDLLLNVRERHEGDTYRVAGCNAELISKTREREWMREKWVASRHALPFFYTKVFSYRVADLSIVVVVVVAAYLAQYLSHPPLPPHVLSLARIS